MLPENPIGVMDNLQMTNRMYGVLHGEHTMFLLLDSVQMELTTRQGKGSLGLNMTNQHLHGRLRIVHPISMKLKVKREIPMSGMRMERDLN